ncbi:MAG: MmcQ/YjbR family DNA-binding protein [Acidobacteriota bacterium]
MADYETVRKIALSLPNVEEGLSYGAPALKAGEKLIIRLREDLDSVVVLTTFEIREELIEAEPETYYITDHYLNYPYVLVSLEHVGEDALGEMIGNSYKLAIAARKPSRKK